MYLQDLKVVRFGYGLQLNIHFIPYLYTAIQNGIDSSVYCNIALIAYSSVYKRGPDSYGVYLSNSNAMISEIVVYKTGVSRGQRLQMQ